MIGIRLMGGLGNQMFQYAAALSASARLGCGLLVLPQPSGIRNAVSHKFSPRPWSELGEQFVGPKQSLFGSLVQIYGGFATMQRAEVVARFLIKNAFSPRREGHDNGILLERYDDRFHSIPPYTWLSGFFQSERYFLQWAPHVRSAFAPSRDLSNRVQSIINTFPLTSSQMIAVHIRRGDYLRQHDELSHPTLGWSLPDSYYDAALEHFGNRPLAVFSDDIEYARKLLGTRAAWFAPPMTGAETLVAISSCGGIVTANSSLSWWAAWLADKSSTVIVAPRHHLGWFRRIWHPDGIEVPGWVYVDAKQAGYN